MKKIMTIALLAMFANATFAQSALELAKQQAELKAYQMKALNAKPTKDAKKQAKQFKKEGWTVPAGEKSIEQQITESHVYGEELMADRAGNAVKRYITHTAIQAANTYNAGYASARANALTELGGMLKTNLIAAIETQLNNEGKSAIDAVSVDKFNQKARYIVDETLTNSIPMLTIYRRLPNNNFEVQVRLAFDKKNLIESLKAKMQKELEIEGNKLTDIVEQAVNRVN